MVKLHKIEIITEGKAPEIHTYSDIHYGNKCHDVKSFELFLKTTEKDPDSYVLGLGDWIEGKTKDSVGYEDQEVKIMPQIRHICKKFKKIADEGRLIGLVRGNHEKAAKKTADIDVMEWMAEKLDVPYFETGVFLKIHAKKNNRKSGKNYTLYGVHGASGARTIGGKINAIHKLGEKFENVDVVCMGHVHYGYVGKGFRYKPIGDYIRTRQPLYIITGHYLEYFGSYAEEKLLPPAGPCGTPKIKFHVDMRRVSGSL
ncbi:MAG: metallophosphoesterase [Candidatus Hermodarchaeota archaeon]